MKEHTFLETWDLDVFYKGGSNSKEFVEHLFKTGKHIKQFSNKVQMYQPANGKKDQSCVLELIKLYELIVKKVRQAGAFVSCLEAQDIKDKQANALRGKVMELSASFQNALTIFDGKISAYDDQQWNNLLQGEGLTELAFVLSERRMQAKNKLGEQEEMLINKLSIDGYHGWSQMYDTIVSSIQIPLEENGQTLYLSVGQAANKFSDPDQNVRKEVFSAWEKAWEDKSSLIAKTLNHLSGFRLNVYEKRGWHNILKEPLEMNRMQEKTLQTMWEVIAANKEPFKRFLERKAKMLGVEKLSWHDLDAPIGNSFGKMNYQEGAAFILKQFSQFGEKMKAFAEKAFADRWIEAEDRQGKRPGGFHTYFPESEQSRIFMTYSGTTSNVSTLAHELGHGFHTYAMKDMHTLNRNYAMNVAETASTFAETIVSDAAVKASSSKAEKIVLLEGKIQNSIALLMNIHARFLFETNFYEERKKGIVSEAKLNEIMVRAQKEAYGEALDTYHPTFWASKLHFYITGVPFYNFPYTFGYLFSLGIYAHAQQEGSGYEKKYMALLKDTASMTVEELAKKHLAVNLAEEVFWQNAIQLCIDDVEEFLELTE
ncbi:M3 family oligoendopeptidase [Niallia sp. NCCP-28]|uniref:M3 family oligoendopeptidase n=1 Tax=Niallia sp. NCCP-28 TaxID=2934712 RepID=UPI00208BEFAB|nr:M3 family oligoendopeptidase [Niallia sp. NCCP-28]GKU81350.1 oligoendopeptidase [Niallia sp. NCCP-28]